MRVMFEGAPAPVTRLLEAANANDTEAFLAAFVDSGVVYSARAVGRHVAEDRRARVGRI